MSFYYIVIIYGLLLIFDIKIVLVLFQVRVHVKNPKNGNKNPLRDSQKKLRFSLFNYVVEWHHLKSHEILASWQ